MHAAGHPEIVSMLIAAGADACARDEYGCTPLHWAAARGRSAVVSQLLDLGARVDAVDDFGHLARPGNRRHIVWRLSPACSGSTPLHHAALSGCADTAQVLLARGADLKAVDIEGKTAEDVARGVFGPRNVFAALRARRVAQEAAGAVVGTGVPAP